MGISHFWTGFVVGAVGLTVVDYLINRFIHPWLKKKKVL
jgi:predicted PurR-regulated permease PerM